MSATIEWQIEWMKTTLTTDSPPECVIEVGWRCNGLQTDGGVVYSGTIGNVCVFNGPGDPFTPYADLTQDQVLGWCWASGVDKVVTEFAVQQQIDNQINPPFITPPLPWVQP